MSGFSVDWLNLREDADTRARNKLLLRRAQQWLEDASDPAALPIVVDLGAGTGATLRALAVPEARTVVWRLVEHDENLLEEACRRHSRHYRIEEFRLDLAVTANLPLEGARLITASALFDLVSTGFIDSLVARLSALSATQSVGLYSALTYNGTTAWTPSHPLDQDVLEAFNRDQCRDKGFGQALGPAAAAYLQCTLEQAGFSVSTSHSDWVLGATDQAMTAALIEGIAQAVAGDEALDAEKLQHWKHFRLMHLADGSCTIGHSDTLALPSSG